LEGGNTDYQAASHAFNKLGVVTAPLIGGNLCMMAHLIGSTNSLETTGKLLFMEDIGEHHYNLDRLMIQVKKAGILDQLAGLIVGGFTDMKDTAADFGATASEIIQSHLVDFSYPICFDFPISHATANYPVIEGGEYTLNIQSDKVTLSLNRNKV
jgi:muramoyltetrapeptide carboxypeptidase